ncbi:MAG: VWA domain-containing protein, partial [Gammaproteobacteria bacterium]|nr:VWA domain-containing protein [Gammaproteobacteria bacterium]
MKNKRREVEGISLSFLDVVSCGFGAIILLLVLTKVFDPIVLEETIEDITAYLEQLEAQLFDIRGETRELNREMIRKEDEK